MNGIELKRGPEAGHYTLVKRVKVGDKMLVVEVGLPKEATESIDRFVAYVGAEEMEHA